MVVIPPHRDRLKHRRAAERIMTRGLKRQVDYLVATVYPQIVALAPQYTRDADPNLDPIFAELTQEFDNIAVSMSADMDALHAAVAVDHTDQWVKNVKSALGIDISALVEPLDDTLNLASQRTTTLIKKASADLAADISRATVDALAAGQSQAQLAKELKVRWNRELQGSTIGRTDDPAEQRRRVAARPRGEGRPRRYQNRYQLIARDQLTTLRANLDQIRQQEAGVEKYRWKDSDDRRVRSTHRSRDNLIYQWTHRHPDGHPGEPINCRCIAQAVIEFD